MWTAQIGRRPTITRTADISTGHRTYLNVTMRDERNASAMQKLERQVRYAR